MSTQPFDPEKAENLEEIEKQWAVKAVEQAQVYWNLLSSIQPRSLRLTRLDDELFDDFSKTFPQYIENPDALTTLDEDQVKSKEAKEQWRTFMGRYEKKITDYNFGTLIRPDCKDEYTEKNSMFVTRTQFYAIEIARNRLGLNDEIHVQAKAHADKEKKAKAAAATS
ncbi:hypothetical protein FRB90_011016 [Tulasnella sp. 427]|nr:hypothetical protein FRB90_011016 [Tulasnella sp. 427]